MAASHDPMQNHLLAALLPVHTSAISATRQRISPHYDDLVDSKEEPTDLSKIDASINDIELQDRELIAAIREGREPESSVAQVLDCHPVPHDLEQQFS